MKSTKKSLLLSTLSLMMCVAMLLGTTYAWFTDSVTSGKNKIIAGNLDVKLVSAKKGIVGTGTELFADVSKWEPGVAVYDTLTVENVGNLALKYQLNMIFDNEIKVDGHGLSEVLKVGTYSGEITSETKRETVIDGVSDWAPISTFSKGGTLAASTDDGGTTYVIYWQPGDSDNLYNMNNTNQGKTLSIDFGVNLVATQDTVEKDSFDEKYDEMAKFPVSVEAKVEENKPTKLTAYDTDNKLAAKAVIPANASALEGASKVLMTVDEADKPTGITVQSNENSTTYDIKFFSVTESGAKTQITDFGTTIVNVDLSAQIPNNADLTRVYHTHNSATTEMTNAASAAEVQNGQFYYNKETKMLTIGSSKFSPITFIYKELVAKIGTNTYDSLQAAFDAAESSDTVTLLADVPAATNPAILSYGKNITLDANGKTIAQAIENCGVMTVTGNGKFNAYVRNDQTDHKYSKGSYSDYSEVPGASMTIENGTFTKSVSNMGNNHVLTVNGGTFNAQVKNENYNYGCSVILNGGTFNSWILSDNDYSSVTFNGGTFNNDKMLTYGTISGPATVNGGTFNENYVFTMSSSSKSQLTFACEGTFNAYINSGAPAPKAKDGYTLTNSGTKTVSGTTVTIYQVTKN